MEFGEAKIYLAKIIEVNKSLVRVVYNGTQSDFVPYTKLQNGFKTHYIPPTKDEVVLYLKIQGFSLVLGTSIINDEKELESDAETILYKDGTKITYKDSVLKVESLKELIIECSNATIKAKENATITANSVVIDSGDIILGGKSASLNDGVVTGSCLCPFTGGPHADFSLKVKALK
ncbi:hypothetical protein [Helicobacter cetorum]|uniref:Phage baseplate assembly protein V n=1 Tax=Helicobacter cetorum (strain ATCC BAA-540 / CCUG 52418 / MIT 99-5656) TaxID=1163745 RepID=I0ER96_HELCM|nr:hypothetical protein [Helicobacter cetorum]AFI05465.1 hypothetical protein HCD_02205 [Helicobacter cetorum MIT 99-5656]